MREIKFRAWDKQTKKMWHSDGTPLSMKITFGPSCIFCVGKSGYDPSANHIMQFTGLHDKNGKEVYEGDVIKMVTTYVPNNGAIGIVEWDSDYPQFWIRCIEGSKRAFHSEDGPNWFSEIVEVIGNVFENKELLNDNKKTKKD